MEVSGACPLTALSSHSWSGLVVNEVRIRLPVSPSAQPRVFSAVDRMRLQSALGWLEPDGVPSHTTDGPLRGQPSCRPAVLPSTVYRSWTPAKLGISLPRWLPEKSMARVSRVCLEAPSLLDHAPSWCQKCDLPPSNGRSWRWWKWMELRGACDPCFIDKS